MARDADPGKYVAILRALAYCLARDADGLRIRETSGWRPLPGSDRVHLEVDPVDRDSFWRAVRSLKAAGAVDEVRLFRRNSGPGVREQVHQDRAIELAQTLLLYANAGHQAEVVQETIGHPSGETPEQYRYTFRLTVSAQAFDSFRSDLPGR